MCMKIIYVIWRHSFIRLAVRHGFGPALGLCPSENSQHSTNLEWESWLDPQQPQRYRQLQMDVAFSRAWNWRSFWDEKWEAQRASWAFCFVILPGSNKLLSGLQYSHEPHRLSLMLIDASHHETGNLKPPRSCKWSVLWGRTPTTHGSPGRIPHCWLCCKIWRKCHLYSCRARLEQRWRPHHFLSDCSGNDWSCVPPFRIVKLLHEESWRSFCWFSMI